MTVYEYEDEIDLRPYLLNIVKHWWQIGLIVIFSVSAALAYGLTRSRNYESTATILVTRSRAVLSLANQFPTVNEPVDYRSRMEAFQSIASSDGVALKTIKQLQDRQPIASQQLEDFKRSTEISSSGDIIKVTSTAKNPQLAAQIANTWARQAVTAINQAYSGEELPGEIQSQIQAAQQEYQQAQTSLESFMQENQISLLQKQLEEAEGVLDTLVKERMRKIAYFSQRGENMDQIISQAEALKSQIEGGSTSAAAGIGDALAILRARLNTFGIAPIQFTTSEDGKLEALPSNPGDLVLNFQMNGLSDQNLSVTADDLDNLIQQAQTEKEKALNSLDALSQADNTSLESVSIDNTNARIQDLQTRLEEQQARQRELTANRDLTWKAYQAFLEKETELKNTSQTNNQVNIATEAVVPEKPTSRGTLQKMAIAGILGLFVGVAWLVGSQWWRSFNQDKIDES
jgi:uncharacterized protein involved in exopolysaccharide biosynthesis